MTSMNGIPGTVLNRMPFNPEGILRLGTLPMQYDTRTPDQTAGASETPPTGSGGEESFDDLKARARQSYASKFGVPNTSASGLIQNPAEAEVKGVFPKNIHAGERFEASATQPYQVNQEQVDWSRSLIGQAMQQFDENRNIMKQANQRLQDWNNLVTGKSPNSSLSSIINTEQAQALGRSRDASGEIFTGNPEPLPVMNPKNFELVEPKYEISHFQELRSREHNPHPPAQTKPPDSGALYNFNKEGQNYKPFDPAAPDTIIFGDPGGGTTTKHDVDREMANNSYMFRGRYGDAWKNSGLYQKYDDFMNRRIQDYKNMVANDPNADETSQKIAAALIPSRNGKPWGLNKSMSEDKGKTWKDIVKENNGNITIGKEAMPIKTWVLDQSEEFAKQNAGQILPIYHGHNDTFQKDKYIDAHQVGEHIIRTVGRTFGALQAAHRWGIGHFEY